MAIIRLALKRDTADTDADADAMSRALRTAYPIDLAGVQPPPELASLLGAIDEIDFFTESVTSRRPCDEQLWGLPTGIPPKP
jgi:hypothetical protein